MIDDRPNSGAFGEFARELLSTGRLFRFEARGRSMLPAIADGDLLYVSHPRPDELKRGDIVLFRRGGEFRAHRIIRKTGKLFITRGDSGMETDGQLEGDDIVGKVIAKECPKTGRIVSLRGTTARVKFYWRELRRRASQSIRPARLGYFLVIPLLLLAPVSLRAQVSIDNRSSGSQLLTGGPRTVALNPLPLTVTAGGTNRLLVVSVSMNDTGTGDAASIVTGITYGAQAFPAGNSFKRTTNNMRVEIWYLIAPNTGTHNVVVTINKTGGGALGVVVGAIDFTGADQTSPIRGSASNAGTSTAPQVTIASSVAEIVLDTLATAGSATATVGAGQTQQWNRNSGTTARDARGLGSTKPGAASVTMSETLSASHAWTIEAISIRPPGADLAIAKSGSPNPVLQNATLTYTLTITNNGPLAATGVIVSDTLPSQVSFVSATSTQGTCTQNSGLVTCSIGTINNLGTVTVTITVTAVTPSQATNTATVSSASIDPNLTNNQASVTTVIEYPTAVNVNSFSASAAAGGVLLSWRSGGELHNLGFNVYRYSGGEKVRLNPSLIAGSALLMHESLPQHGAKSYGWIDRSATAGGSYWLEDVDINGTRTMHGPVSVQSSSMAPAMAAPRTALKQLTSPSTNLPTNAPGATHVKEVVAHPQLSASSADIGFKLAAQHAVKIFVDHEGWYRISQSQLVAAGLAPNLDAASLHLFAEGVEQPIRITGSSRSFGPQSAIEFYGTAIDTAYSGQRVYWLTSQTSPGLRIPDMKNSGSPGPQPQSFLQTLELKPRTTYFAALLRENTDNFFGPLVSPTAESQTFTVSNLASGEGRVNISLQGVTTGQQHDVTVQLNGATLGDVVFSDQDVGKAEFTVPNGVFINGTNTITLTAQQGATDISLVDIIDVSIPHTFTAESDLLKFTADAGENVTVKGFSHAPNRLLDISDPLHPVLLDHKVTSQNGGFSLQATIPWTTPGQHTLLALSDAQLASPVALLQHLPTHLHDKQAGASMIVLTVPQFAAQLQPLVAWHQQQGTPTTLINVDDVYDEFNFGERTPFAIRAFLQAAAAAWKNKPQYLLLGGDASVDPRDYLGFGFFDFVPTRIVITSELKTASDDWFSDFNGSGLATIATGRMPARTAADMQTMVSKTLGYVSGEPGNWNTQALLVADQDDPDVSFTQAAQSLQKLLPATITANDVFATALGPTTARQDIVTAINNGQLFVNYNGHGSVQIWSGNDLFDDAAASALSNGNKLPLFVIMNCLNGFFHDVYTESLATALMLAPNGGSVAVWASSGLTQPEPQFQMDQSFVKTVFAQPSTNLGDAAMLAKSGISDLDVRRTFILFGDPAITLALPSGSASLKATMPRGDRAH